MTLYKKGINWEWIILSYSCSDTDDKKLMTNKNESTACVIEKMKSASCPVDFLGRKVTSEVAECFGYIEDLAPPCLRLVVGKPYNTYM